MIGLALLLSFIAPQFVLVAYVSARRDGQSVLSRAFWLGS